MCHRRREPCLAQAPEQRLHVVQARGSGAGRPDLAGRPRVAQQDLMSGDRAQSDGLLPVGPALGDLDLGHDHVEDAVDDVALPGDVVVQRHRLDAQLARQLAHGEGRDSVAIGELERRTEHPIPAERDPGRGARGAFRGDGDAPQVIGVIQDWRPSRPLDNLTPYDAVLQRTNRRPRTRRGNPICRRSSTIDTVHQMSSNCARSSAPRSATTASSCA